MLLRCCWHGKVLDSSQDSSAGLAKESEIWKKEKKMTCFCSKVSTLKGEAHFFIVCRCSLWPCDKFPSKANYPASVMFWRWHFKTMYMWWKWQKGVRLVVVQRGQMFSIIILKHCPHHLCPLQGISIWKGEQSAVFQWAALAIFSTAAFSFLCLVSRISWMGWDQMVREDSIRFKANLN